MTYREQIWTYRTEFIEQGEDMAGTAGLSGVKDVEEWLLQLEKNSSEETVTDGLVPATTLLAIRKSDNQLVGIVDIRHRLNEWLLRFGGHLGYSVRKLERGQGYAKEMVRLALDECRQLGLSEILITCDKENIASAKVVLANGGVLENEIPEEGRITQRYWINLN